MKHILHNIFCYRDHADPREDALCPKEADINRAISEIQAAIKASKPEEMTWPDPEDSILVAAKSSYNEALLDWEHNMKKKGIL